METKFWRSKAIVILGGLVVALSMGALFVCPLRAVGATSEEEAAAFWRSTLEAVDGLWGAEMRQKQGAIYKEIMGRFPQTRVALCARANLAGVQMNQILHLRRQGRQEAADELAITTIQLLRPLLHKQDFGAAARIRTAWLNEG